MALFHLQLISAPSSLGQHNPAVSLMGASYLTWFPPSLASLVQPELSAPWQSSSTPFWVSLFHLQLSSASSSLGFTCLPVSTPPRRSSLCTLPGLLVLDPAPSFWVLLLQTWARPPLLTFIHTTCPVVNMEAGSLALPTNGLGLAPSCCLP